ncbi:PAS domain S-box protein [candidate division KSB1 bacterium]|nr:PAS domain S-box protein [candidate division KSB1 bacterium]
MLKSPIRKTFKAEILDLAPVNIAVHDKNQTIIWANKEYRKAVGHSLKEIAGRKCYSIWNLSEPCNGCPVLKAIETGEPQEAELTPQNQEHWTTAQGSWLSKAVPIRDDEGNIIGAIETAYDITERKQIEEEKEKNQRILSDAEKLADLGSWVWDIENDLITPSDNWLRIHGCSKRQLTTREIMPIAHPDDRPKIKKALDMAVRYGEPYQVEHRIIRQDTGEVRYVKAYGDVRRDESGKVIKLIGAGQDLTKNKHAEIALRESEERYRALFQQMPSGVAVYEAENDGEDFIIKDFNAAAENIENVKRADLIGKRVTEAFPGVEPFGMLDVFRRVWKTGDFEYFPEGIYKDERDPGSWRESWIYKLPSGDIVAVYNDITQRKQAEERLKFLANLLDAVEQAVIVTDQDGHIIYWNPFAEKFYGWKESEVFGRNIMEVTVPQITKEQGAEIMSCLNAGKSWSGEFSVQRRDGTIFPAIVTDTPLFDSNGNLSEIIGITTDITELKNTESELQAERERLKVTLQSIGDGVITTDVEGNVVLLNRVAEALTGWSQKEAKGKKLNEIFHVIDVQTEKPHNGSENDALQNSSVADVNINNVLISRDGTERIIADSKAPIVDADGNTVGIVLVFRDITDKIKLETELRHAHKMEAIGNLAGGIAHEFNNVLGIIIGNTELGLLDVEKWHPVAENLNEIKLASLRAKDVVKQMLSFSRKMDIKREPVDIRIIIKESIKLLRASIPTTIQLRQKFSEKVDTLVADPTQIHQLVINLCNNAAQAMSDNGGTLTIELSNITLTNKTAPAHSNLRPGNYVQLSVRDTGHGIPPDALDKIFDPYFTTKDAGKGTGMGLAVVHGIVKAHEGVIDVESSVGSGTAFHIYFPASRKKPQRHKTMEISLPTGSENILFVDDEKSIVKLCNKILSQLGYSVTYDTDPIHIRELFRSDPQKYDLVITDMTMPNLSGDRLAIDLLQIRPDIPIIICTGFSEKISPEKAEQMGIKGFLMKPVEQVPLAKLVRKVLDEAKNQQ